MSLAELRRGHGRNMHAVKVGSPSGGDWQVRIGA